MRSWPIHILLGFILLYGCSSKRQCGVSQKSPQDGFLLAIVEPLTLSHGADSLACIIWHIQERKPVKGAYAAWGSTFEGFRHILCGDTILVASPRRPSSNNRVSDSIHSYALHVKRESPELGDDHTSAIIAAAAAIIAALVTQIVHSVRERYRSRSEWKKRVFADGLPKFVEFINYLRPYPPPGDVGKRFDTLCSEVYMPKFERDLILRDIERAAEAEKSGEVETLSATYDRIIENIERFLRRVYS